MKSAIFFNGRIVTMDPARPDVEAVAIRDGHIVSAGSLDDAYRNLPAGEAPRLLDLKGRVLVPGFIDAHAHLALFANELSGIPLKRHASIQRIVQAVHEAVQVTPPGQWIRGSGYNDFYLAERRHPTRHDLDRVSPNHPVLLTRTCGHIAVANSLALKLAGIPLDDVDPEGGRYGRDADGRLNGVLFDQALTAMQEASKLGLQEMKRYLSRASEMWAQAGITAFHDAGGPPGYLSVLVQAYQEGRIGQRVDAMIWNGLGVNQLSEFLSSGVCTGFHFGDLYIGAAKVMTDGSSSGPTAATREPYASDSSSTGILYHNQDELDRVIRLAARQGFQVTTHAVGDQAIEESIKSISQFGDATRRNRIEHCAMCPPDLIAALVRAKITPVGQPHFLWEFGDGYVKNYGWDRARQMFPFRSWFDAGLLPAGSSDSPVTDFRPLRGVASALFRQTQSGQVLSPEERLTFLQAMALYTVNAARLTFSESQMGQIKRGYVANLAILGEDITRMTSFEDIADCPVDATLIRGQVVWNSGYLPLDEG